MLFCFFVVLVAGYLVGKKHRADSADEFLTGGGSLGWFKTGLTMVAMSIDTGIMRIVDIGFVWGFAIQWNAVVLGVLPNTTRIFVNGY